MENVLLYFSIKYKGDWDKIYNALDKKEKISHKELDEVENQIDCDFITILSPKYPNFLKNTHKPPFVIYYKGNIELLSNYSKTIAILGGEQVSEYAEKSVEKLVRELEKENIIFSTIENVGVNAEIIDLAVANDFKVISVVDGDMKDFLKRTIDLPHKPNLLSINEIYESGIKINEQKIDYTNRILCGISKILVFVSFKDSPYINKLFAYALNEGKEVFAVPESIFSSNDTNKLIKNGAKLTENAKDILNEIY